MLRSSNHIAITITNGSSILCDEVLLSFQLTSHFFSFCTGLFELSILCPPSSDCSFRINSFFFSFVLFFLHGLLSSQGYILSSCSSPYLMMRYRSSGSGESFLLHVESTFFSIFLSSDYLVGLHITNKRRVHHLFRHFDLFLFSILPKVFSRRQSKFFFLLLANI